MDDACLTYVVNTIRKTACHSEALLYRSTIPYTEWNYFFSDDIQKVNSDEGREYIGSLFVHRYAN